MVLFDKTPEVEKPFGLYPRAMFSSREIHDRWIDSMMDHSSRLKTLRSIVSLPRQQLCLFGKIEEGNYLNINSWVWCMLYLTGISKEQRNSAVDSLNVQYQTMLSTGSDQTSALYSLVTKFPYRFFNNQKKVRLKLIHFISLMGIRKLFQ